MTKNEQVTIEPLLSKALNDLMWGLGPRHYIAMRPLILKAMQLEKALGEIAGMRLLTGCGIDPMRAAGQRQAFEITAEIANKALNEPPSEVKT
jgi:hypothetical protein